MAMLQPGAQGLAAARSASPAGAAQEAAVLQALTLLRTALDVDEAAPRHALSQGPLQAARRV